ncbi:glycosyltransferase family 2 protein [Ectothiorhodospiraceae bacterium WFHF3C12]|nr:glycosyltransferase family 2 protein [Ectothiorhodospiraceae bacterium WFHF3C12]
MTDQPPAPYFSVFIPTYNRAGVLPRALRSVAEQTFRDLELVVVDDGSSDDTRDIVTAFAETVDFPVRYHWQENQGKHGAYNTALGLLRGRLTVVLDSDDRLVPQALEILKHYWESIPESQRAGFVGVKGMCRWIGGEIYGDSFPSDVFDSDDLSLRTRDAIKGDKVGAVCTEVIREYPYPVVAGERHQRPSYVQRQIAHRYRVRYVNEVIQECEHQPGGLSSDRFALRMRNPRGYRLYHLADIRDHRAYLRFTELLDGYGKYVRFSLHGGIGLRQQWREAPSKLLWLACLPYGAVKYLTDRLQAGRRS